MKNPGLKIAALLCAVSLWFFVVANRHYRVSFEIPVQFIGIPEPLALASRPPTTVHATLEGNGLDLMRIHRSSDLARLEIPLQNAELGMQRIYPGSNHFRAPSFPGVTFVDLVGSKSIEVELDTKIKRMVPVRSKVSLKAAAGYTIVGEPVLSPPEVALHGARKILTRVFEVPTKEREFTALKWDMSIPVDLDFSGLAVTETRGTPQVTLNVKVQPLERRIYEGVTVQLIGLYDRSQWHLEPATATVELLGGKDVLTAIGHQDIQLFIEFSRFSIEGLDSLAPTVRIRETIQSWQVHPETFHLVPRRGTSHISDSSKGLL